MLCLNFSTQTEDAITNGLISRYVCTEIIQIVVVAMMGCIILYPAPTPSATFYVAIDNKLFELDTSRVKEERTEFCLLSL